MKFLALPTSCSDHAGRKLAGKRRRTKAYRLCVIADARGGEDQSAYADASRRLEWFGEPTVTTDEIIDRAVRATLALHRV